MSPLKSNLPILLFEPDGYVLDGPKLMGRQSAGNGFLRAAINTADESAAAGGPAGLFAYSPHRSSGIVFEKLVSGQSSAVKGAWIPADRIDLLAAQRALFVPGPGIGSAAQFRLRAGPGAWSITGVTYTLCSHSAMDAITDILAAPVMPWDALICATSVAKHAVNTLFELQAQYFLWRFGVKNFVIPQLPIIPFGVHAEDFSFDSATKQNARVKLEIASDEIAVLFAGRLSFHAKAHPYPMLLALETAAQRTGKKVHLLLCGQFPNEAVKDAFLSGAKRYAPSIRTQWVDGKEPSSYSCAWAGSDIFVSLSDNLQETFGITPVEAMASGLPAIVTDWDGYKDTVVDGETGFRIPTWMPPPDLGSALATAFEAGTINYDRYIGLACMDVSFELSVLVDRLIVLIEDPQKRAQMGNAGRRRVAAYYDWRIVMRQHLDLWSSLEDLRKKAVTDEYPALKNAPLCDPGRQDPFRVFASFPTRLFEGRVNVVLGIGSADDWQALCQDGLFSYAADDLPKRDLVQSLLTLLSQHRAGRTIEEIGKALGWSLAQTIKRVAPLAKVGLVRLTPDLSNVL